MAEVRVIYGPERSPRTEVIDALVAEKWGETLLLVPTHQYATRRTEEILGNHGLAGSWDRPVLTFPDFVATLLGGEGLSAVALDEMERRILFEQAIAKVLEKGAAPEDLGRAMDTEGFLAHIQRVVAKLKQAAVDPAEFRMRAAMRKHPSPFDGLVADIYEAYQDALHASGAYDGQGLFWEANLICRQRQPAILRNISAIFIDSFDDFTPSELRLLTAIEPHVDTLVFGLPHDHRADRADLYTLQAATLNELRGKFTFAPEDQLEHPLPATFAEFAADHIFWRDKFPETRQLRANIEILPCQDYLHEIEAIGRHIKSLLLDSDVPPGEIAVVYRDLNNVTGPFRSVFAQFGIPLRCIQRPGLAESPLCVFVMTFLEASLDWQRDAVLDILCSPWFRPDKETPPSQVRLFPAVARRAQVIGGIDEWKERLKRFIERSERKQGGELEDFHVRHPEALNAARTLLERIQWLEGLAATLPKKAEPGEFGRALDLLIDQLGIPRALDAPDLAYLASDESRALETLRAVLGRFGGWDQHAVGRLDRSELVKRLHQACASTTYAIEEPQEGVTLLDMESVRHLRFDHVILAAANQDELPKPSASSAIYTEEDLENLRDADIPLEGKDTHGAREMLLFHHVLTVPRKDLLITWHLTSRQGKARNPSPYLADLRELFPETNMQRPAPETDAFVPVASEAASWRDLRNHAFLRQPGLQQAFAEDFQNIAQGAAIEKQRHAATPFGPYDGQIGRPDLKQEVADRFGPRHAFSVNQLETYANCPFAFFAQRLLNIDEAETPVAEFDARLRGTILHAILEDFHAHFVGKAIPEIPADEARSHMAELVNRQFDAKGWLSATAPPGVVQIEKQRLDVMLGRYLNLAYADGATDWKPSHFEVAFGKVRGETPDALCKPKPYPLSTPVGEVLFAGRIDRVDLDGKAARIVDYKTSTHPKPMDIKAGRAIQLAVYALALDEYLSEDTECAEAIFLTPGKKKTTEALKRRGKKVEWPSREETARTSIGKYVADIRAGFFPPLRSSDGACRYCPAHKACRYEEARIERKEAAMDQEASS